MMPVPAQILNAPDKNWIVFIKDEAFDTLYDVYIRNFDVQNKQRKEYSVLWFRQMWKNLNDLASRNHSFTSAVEDIENTYHASSPPYGQIQFEAKVIYSRKDFKYYNVLIVDGFNYTLPYTDIYGGRRVIIEQIHNTMNKTKKRITITMSQLHDLIKEAINEIDRETYANAAREQAKKEACTRRRRGARSCKLYGESCRPRNVRAGRRGGA